MIHNAHSNELRRKLLKLMESGENKQELARQFNVGTSSLYRILRQKRETGRADPGLHSQPGPPCAVDTELKNETLLLLERRPEMSVSDVQRYWQSKGARLGHSRVHQILGKIGWNSARKKAQMLKVYGTSSLHKVWIMTGQPERLPKPRARSQRALNSSLSLTPKNPVYVELGRKGGKATAEKRTPEQRKEASRRAVQARWARLK